MDFEKIKFSIEKMIDHKETDTSLLYTILTNIQCNMDQDKYKTIKVKKLNNHTKNILECIGFKRKVVMFEEFYVFDVSNTSVLDLCLKVIGDKQKIVQKRELHKLAVSHQIKMEKQQKDIVHDQLMNERIQRKKYNGWLT